MDASRRTTESTDRPRAAGTPGARGVFLRPRQPAGHVVMFWVLTGMATAIFAPCVLIPVWIEAEEVHAYEQAMDGVIGDLEARVADHDARMEALRADPLVNDRISRRELNHRPAGERITAFLPAELSLRLRTRQAATAEADPSGDTVPSWILAVKQWLPDWPWRKLFAESPNRAIMLLMAAGLLFSAFFLYGQPLPTWPNSSD